MADGKLVSKNVVLSNIFYNKKQLLIVYIYISPHGAWLHWDFFFFKSSCHTWDFISALPVQWRHQVSWWAGKSLLGSLLVRQVAVGLGDRRSVHTGHGSVMKTNQVICIDFCSQEENRGPPPERARQLSELSPQLLRLLDLVLFSSSWLWTTPVPLFFFFFFSPLNPRVTWRIRSGRRTPVTIS